MDERCDQLLAILAALPSSEKVMLKVLEFDKDVDAHMKVIAACSNLRARNYAIVEADLHTSRGIAGNVSVIIPFCLF